MILNEELISTFEELDLNLYSAFISIENLLKNGIRFNEFENIVTLAKQYEIDTFYYFYIYYEKEEFIIPDEYHNNYAKAFQLHMSEKINDYNKYVETMNFSEPATLFLYFPYDGFIHYFYIDNESYELLLPYEDKISEIEKLLSEEISSEDLLSIRLEVQKEQDTEVEKIREIILEDEKFQSSTNERFRRNYANRLLDLYPEYQNIIRNAGYRDILSFFHETYKIYKENAKNK